MCVGGLSVQFGQPGLGQTGIRNVALYPARCTLDLEQDLSGTIVKGKTGRHPLPEPTAFAAVASRFGIDASTHVVAYDDGSCMFALRLWWLMKWLGHARVSVLRGGIKAWVAEGYALETVTPTPEATSFVATPNPNVRRNTHGRRGQRCGRLPLFALDARAEPRFRGEQEPIDPIAGHIPTAKNLPFTNLLEAGGPKPTATVRALFDGAVAPAPATDVIAYCGSGVTACALIWAAACAGVEGIRLYPGSWSEWITSDARPVARG